MTAPRDDSPTRHLTLTSAAFRDGESIPVRHTCDGEDLSPPLAWTGVPVETRTFALICDDPTLRAAPGFTGSSGTCRPTPSR